MIKPPDITDGEWAHLTSPEVYFADGEYNEPQARANLQRQVARLQAMKRHPAYRGGPLLPRSDRPVHKVAPIRPPDNVVDLTEYRKTRRLPAKKEYPRYVEMAVACDFCKAPSGKPCHVADDPSKVRDEPHEPRRRMFSRYRK